MAEKIEHMENPEPLPEEPETSETLPETSDAASAGDADSGEVSAPADEVPAERGNEVAAEEVAGDEAPAAAVPEDHVPAEENGIGEPVAPAGGEAESEAETLAPAPAPEPEADKKWYIIHTYSGFESKVADSLRSRAQAFGFADKIGNVLIPTEEVVEMRAGRKVISKRLLYPGYVLVEMAMDDQLWHEVKNTPRVTGFVGGGNNPVPLSADEVNSILYRQATSADRPRPKQTFEKNETVRIIDGPFASFSGKVDEINSERDTLRVMVTIFGRSTPVELEFTQVEKIS